MKKKEFQNLPNTNTPITAETLNEMQENIEESAVVVSSTEPTTNEKVWIKLNISKNMLNEDKTLFNHNIKQATGILDETDYYCCCEEYINVKSNTSYIFSANKNVYDIYIASACE